MQHDDYATRFHGHRPTHTQFRSFHVNLDEVNVFDFKFVKDRIQAPLLDFNRILPALMEIRQYRMPTALVAQVQRRDLVRIADR